MIKLNRSDSYLDKILKSFGFLGIIFMFAHLFIVWLDLPETVPTHFNFWGEPDGFGAKGNMLILPFVALGTYIMLTLISRFPNAFNYPENITAAQKQYLYVNSRRMLNWLNLQIVYFFLYGTWKTTQIALEKQTGLATYSLPIFLVAMTITMAYYIIKGFRITKTIKENGGP
jgi:uncharacterized membrane protein